ncbi:hypothetical protein D3C81_1005800 [compost metagenome]
MQRDQMAQLPTWRLALQRIWNKTLNMWCISTLEVHWLQLKNYSLAPQALLMGLIQLDLTLG